MKGVVIAAGAGVRMRPITATIPKCMVPVAGRPLIEWSIERLRNAGCDDIAVIVGHRGDLVRPIGVSIIENTDYQTNNILQSLMKARDYFDGPLLVSYSDIWVEPHIYSALVATLGDIVVAVDTDWQPYYENRSQHPVSEAEKVLVDSRMRATAFGKRLQTPGVLGSHNVQGEFLGLWRMSTAGAQLFRDTFLELDALLGRGAPFQGASSWLNAYVTDMFLEILERGGKIQCALVQRGWAELDTLEDLERLPSIARRQRLNEFVRASKEVLSR
jgi:L-glutamine-phosphate cytidylyltransferase